MPQTTEAIFSKGVLRPLSDLGLREAQRVRIIVEPLGEDRPPGREAALDRLRQGIQAMKFVSQGPLPGRDELHDRS